MEKKKYHMVKTFPIIQQKNRRMWQNRCLAKIHHFEKPLNPNTISLCDTCMFVCLMVRNATFNNISVISWRSVLLVEETGEP